MLLLADLPVDARVHEQRARRLWLVEVKLEALGVVKVYIIRSVL